MNNPYTEEYVKNLLCPDYRGAPAEDQVRKVVAFELSKRMQNLGLTRTQVARKSGVRLNTVTRLLDGSADTRFGNVVKVAHVLGLDFQANFLQRKFELEYP